ncbi:MAG: alpha/beta hydrolase [Actinomycetota bacterium]
MREAFHPVGRGPFSLAPHTPEMLEEMRDLRERARQARSELPDPTTPAGLEANRAYLARLRKDLGDFMPADLVEERVVSARGASVPVRIIKPAKTPVAVHLGIHAGGWASGFAAFDDLANLVMTELLGVVTVSVEYRLAPEHPFPAGPDDCETGALWLVENAGREFGTNRLTTGGGSAGAHLAVITLLRLRDRHSIVDQFCGASLGAGVYDLSGTPSVLAAGDRFVNASTRGLLAAVERCMPGATLEGLREPGVSPLYADLSEMPPARFQVGTHDPTIDDTMFMAARWQAAGNIAEVGLYPEAHHGFEGLGELGRQAFMDQVGFLDKAISGNLG